MAKIQVNPENYFTVQGWMITELGLKGNALMIYAIIYGFSQTPNTKYTGSIDYLCEWLGGVSRPTVINILDNLVQQGLLTKDSVTKGALIYNSYTAVLPSKKILPTSKEILLDTSKKILPNNIDINNIENKNSLSKDKEEQAPGDRKYKNYGEIYKDLSNSEIRVPLETFISNLKAKYGYTPKVTTVAKFAETLRELSSNNSEIAMRIVQQSIDNGWKALYKLKERHSRDAVSVPFNPDRDILATDSTGNTVVY
jgi:predicted DNA-binding transcriptional regulator